MSRGVDITPSILSVDKEQGHLAFHYTEGRSPGVLLCNGFQSSMTGNKAVALQNYCHELGVAFCRFDYRGHGSSSGFFVDCTLSEWIQDASDILTKVMSNHKKVVVVGSSMGGWIACHLALLHPDKVSALLGIATAPDFLEDIFEKSSHLQRESWKRRGFTSLPTEYGTHPYTISWNLLHDARLNWNILRQPVSQKIPIKCRVHLFHGKQDRDVDWKKSMDLMERLDTDDVVLSIVKDGDHRLSRPQDLNRICMALGELLHTTFLIL